MLNRTTFVRPLAILIFLALVTQGCSTSGTFNFTAEPRINNGLLLTIDMVLISESEEQQIRDLGDEWFYSDLRRRLGSRTRTVTLEGGDRRTVTLVPDKGCKECTRLGIIADYKYEGRDQKVQMEFRSKESWKGQTLQIRVFDRHLEIRRG